MFFGAGYHYWYIFLDKWFPGKGSYVIFKKVCQEYSKLDTFINHFGVQVSDRAPAKTGSGYLSHSQLNAHFQPPKVPLGSGAT